MIYRQKRKRGNGIKKVMITSIVIIAVMLLVWLVISLYDQENTKPPASPPQIKVSCPDHNVNGTGGCSTVNNLVIMVETGNVYSHVGINMTAPNSGFAPGFYWIQASDTIILNDIVIQAMPPVDPVIQARPHPYMTFNLRYINADPANPQCSTAHTPGYYTVPCNVGE